MTQAHHKSEGLYQQTINLPLAGKGLNIIDPDRRERSGSVVECLTRDRVFKPHRSHCVVVPEQDTFILATQEDPSLFN